MTAKELYNICVQRLEFTDDAKFEVKCLFDSVLNIDKNSLIVKDISVSEDDTNKIFDAISRRENHEPLQYIIGNWDFYDMTFSVGEGVLIPRPETEMLVDFALEKIENINSPVIYDLCAGTGCIGLTIAKHRKDTTVYLFEKEENAFKYLKMNREKYGLNNAILIHADIFDYDFAHIPMCDILLSNPPYIKANEIKTLQDEVHHEPVSALDGGEDGLMFYRVICNKWLKQVKKNGFVALECGEEQSQEIIDIFREKYSFSKVIFDFNNIDRIVTFGI